MARGRPRKNDPDKVLSEALKLFWKRGYAGTSMNDISEVTGMAKPGLYATFGDKDALFIKSLERYVEQYGDPVRIPFEQGTGPFREDLKSYLNGLADGVTLYEQPHGCMCILASFDFGDTSEPVGPRLAALKSKGVIALQNRLRRAFDEAELSPNADCNRLLMFLNAQIVAMASLARTGVGRDQLQVIVDMALDAMPWAENQGKRRADEGAPILV
ncbi:TetR/AcrR family transcriptional regulator [uncultured Pelagimonas sp.]|uniref:TetR/AcrR family transcriptional regulator n=1 Tax=uncultured Pelagimonas sp. TaxID=1618102 RepID=UPI00261150FD|nr:TetR/AcrR family transcriptional regulator [uncultured Pelagimonas sp.]